MPIDFTQRGYIEVWRDGVRISQHNREREAVERITIHASENGNGDYEIRHPLVVAKAYGVITPGSGDTEAPTAPGSVSAVATSATTGTVSWTASTDNVGVAGYQIFRDGAPLSTTTNLSFPLTGLSPSTQYSITVVAFDASGNNSSAGGPALFTTDPNSAPVWSLGNQAYETGNAVSIALDSFCTDADADTITYSLVSGTLPSGLALSGARNQTLSGTVDTVETAVFTLGASDGIAAVQTVALTFTITTPDTTAPAAPTGLALTPSNTSIALDWDDNVESDLNYYEVWRSTDGVSFGRRTTIGVGVSVSNYSDNGLNSGTQYWYYITAVDDSGNISSASSTENTTTTTSAALYDLTAAGTRTPPTWATDGTFQWPAVPGTTTTFNVPADGSLSTAVSVSGRQIIVAAGYTHTGNLSVTASDIDILMADTATITGTLGLGNGGVRQRVTGGNVGAGIDISGQPSRATSLIIENVNIEYDSVVGYGIETSGNYERLAILNCTIHDNNPAGQESSGWNIFGNYTGGPTDLIVAGNLINHVAGSQAQTIRIQGLDRYIFIDNGVIGRSSGAGTYGSAFRGLGNNYVWIADCLMRGSWALDGSIVHPGGTRAYGTQNATWERIDSRANSAVFFGDVGSSTGTFNNSTRYTFSGTPTSEVNISPFTGSNNPAVSWDGVTLPSLAGYGADH